jgi:hypothetical protein
MRSPEPRLAADELMVNSLDPSNEQSNERMLVFVMPWIFLEERG